MKKTFSILVLFLTIINSYAQSPWVKEKGKGYAQLSFNMINKYNDLFLESGESYRLPRTVSDRSLQLYGEYGLGNNLQVSMAIPYKMLETGELRSSGLPSVAAPLNQAGTFSALGNIELAVKRNFVNKNYLLSGQVKLELPTASIDEPTGLRSGVDATSIVPSVSVGKGWNDMYGFVSVGSSIRTNDYSGDIRIGGEFGVQPINKLWMILVLDVVSSFENGDVVIPVIQSQTGLYVNNQEYFAYGLKAAYGITDKLGLNFAFYGASSGNFVAKSPSINLGAYFEW